MVHYRINFLLNIDWHISAITFGDGNVIDCRRPVLAYFPDPDDCRNFYHCSDWTGLQKKSCGNLFFNPQTGVCDWPSTVSRLRPECANVDLTVTPPVTNIPKAFQQFTTEERETLRLIHLNNQAVRFPEPPVTTQRPVQQLTEAFPFGQPLAPVLDSLTQPHLIGPVKPPPPPPPPPRAPANSHAARQPLPPPPPPPQVPRQPQFFRQPEQPVVRPQQVVQPQVASTASSIDFVAQAPALSAEEPEFVQPQRPITTIRLVASSPPQPDFNSVRPEQPKQLQFVEAQPPAPPRGAIILPPAAPPAPQPPPPTPPPPTCIHPHPRPRTSPHPQPPSYIR